MNTPTPRASTQRDGWFTAERLRSLVREPLVQFAVIGVVLFVIQSAMDDPDEREAPMVITITAAQIEAAANERETRTKMPLSEAERAAVAETLVREEIYYREAMALGLDRGDSIVRRRLVQKMKFLTDDGNESATPTDPELRAFIAARPTRYQRPHRISFGQVFFSRARRDDPDADAIDFLADVDPSSPVPPRSGDPFMHGTDIHGASESSVNRMFGHGFATALFEQPEGAWSEPIQSTYGTHVVFIHELERQGERPFAEVRESATRDWRRTQSAARRGRVLSDLRARYEVQIEGQAPADE
jgi:hypothetical protein